MRSGDIVSSALFTFRYEKARIYEVF